MRLAIVWLSLLLISWGVLISVVYGGYEITKIFLNLL